MKVQLCWKEKGKSRLFIHKKWMNITEARKKFAKTDNEKITLATLRKWDGQGYLCHKVLKDAKEILNICECRRFAVKRNKHGR